ncbi:conjugative transposon protein TraM [Salegentibacter sp. F14]
MRIDKKKVVFGGVIICVIGFIVLYSLYVFGTEKQPKETFKNPELPLLEVTEKEYESKLEAIDDIEPEKQRRIPELYEPPQKEELERENKLYQEEEMEYWKADSSQKIIQRAIEDSLITLKTEDPKRKEVFEDLSDGHTEFFLGAKVAETQNGLVLKSRVYGNQVIKTGMRIILELMEGVMMGNQKIPKKTLVYGQVSMQQNRVMVTVERIGAFEVSLEAFDLQDKQKGIYIENSFRVEASNQLVGDLVNDINISGIPQVRGLRNIFRRNNRNIKVLVLNNYQLLLKSKS